MMLMITSQPTQKKIRPYWHVDAKWIAGIALFFSLGTCLLLYNLSSLTERANAVNISATIVAGLFSKNGLDDPSGLAELRKLAAHTHAAKISPIPEFPNLKISRHDALTLSPADLRVAIFSQLTGPIYDLGVDGAARQLISDPRGQQQFADQAGALGLLTQSMHDLFQRAWMACAVVSLLLAGAVVFFSAGWGRLVSPGIVLLAISPLGSVVGLALLYAPSGAASFQSLLPTSVAQDVGNSLSHSYLFALLAGAGLLMVALVGKIIVTLVHQSRSTLTPSRS